MQSITIGRFDQDPQAQGVIRPEDGSWQLVIDKEGYPHLYLRIKLDEKGGTGMLCLEDMLDEQTTIPDIMKSTFGGQLSGEEEAEAMKEYEERKIRTGIPCPRMV